MVDSLELQSLKILDPERYLACLYLPEAVRPAAVTIYTFDAEIARIPNLVSEPMPGEIRLQFWRDVLAQGKADGAGPLAENLLTVIDEQKLPAEVFHNYLNARIFDLYQDPMPDMGSFEGYLGETRSAILQMVALSCGLSRNTELAEACGHAGMAIGIKRLLLSQAWLRHNRQIYIPIEVLEKHGLTSVQWLDGSPNSAHLSVVTGMIELANMHHAKALQAFQSLPKDARSVFTPLAFVKPALSAVQKAGIKSFSSPVKISALKRQWTALKWATGY